MFWKSQYSRVLILLKLIYKFNAISIKISTGFFCRYTQDLKIYMKRQIEELKTIFKIVEELNLSDFKTYIVAVNQDLYIGSIYIKNI